MSGDYNTLSVIQKIEVFKYTLSKTDGKDLQRIMWLKSPSSEVWLDQRTNFTRSLAVMSQAGYILGLGDRHPSNIMVDRATGHVVHIDFGDCFEVASLRDKFPEKVPFRLTRMLVNAMEVCSPISASNINKIRNLTLMPLLLGIWNRG
jgi:FKBP12-rapamycin complex-associated protein